MSRTQENLELAQEMAREAGALQKERFETDLDIRTKGDTTNLVTEVDQECEARMLERLSRERPEDSILAEEGGAVEKSGSRWQWIIDPLDGTTNYAHGYPCFCVSIGVEKDGEREVGVIYNPLLDELFYATRGGGAFRNGKPISVSGETDMKNALMSTGFAYDVRRSPADNLNHFASFVKSARAVRRDGSAALDLCYVACGRFDGYWEFKLHPWDVAAGILIVEEAGGRCSDSQGAKAPSSGKEVVASNGVLHEKMLQVLNTWE